MYLVLKKSEMGLIVLKAIPHHSDQQRFYCPTNHPNPGIHSNQYINPHPLKNPISLLVP